MLGKLILILVVMMSFIVCNSASADIRPGVRIGGYFDAGAAFIGGELLMGITDRWYFNPNLEYVFVDNGDLITFNFDIHYDLDTRSNLYFWVGGGPAILYFNRDRPFNEDGDSDTDFGVNLLFGVGFPIHNSRFIPYVQPKVIISDNSEFSLAFGLRF